jgi:hypothetical protein
MKEKPIDTPSSEPANEKREEYVRFETWMDATRAWWRRWSPDALASCSQAQIADMMREAVEAGFNTAQALGTPVSEMSPPVGWPVMAGPKGRWATSLYYADYWWVKKSHAERNAAPQDREAARPATEDVVSQAGGATSPVLPAVSSVSKPAVAAPCSNDKRVQPAAWVYTLSDGCGPTFTANADDPFVMAGRGTPLYLHPSAIDPTSLQRYIYNGRHGLDPFPRGHWVSYADVEALLTRTDRGSK